MLDNKQWYQQFWPWFLISIPLSSIIVCAIIISVAMQHQDDLVTEDYYKKGRAIHLERQKLNRAHELQLIFSLSMDQHQMQLSQTHGQPHHGMLMIHFYHATMAAKDMSFQLTPDANSTYRFELPSLISGQWTIEIQNHDHSWRIRRKVRLDQARITLEA
ncbi:MAG: FixH family protein [Shewanellaceae bacterium]|nr:FixH family protein [Shewanellaceae bacterium]